MLLREAEQHVGSKYVYQVLDSLYVIEMAMRHFFLRAEMGKNAGRKEEEVDEDYKQAAALAALVAPYRHARLSAVKLAGDQNNPLPFRDLYVVRTFRTFGLAIREYVAHLVWRFRLRLPADAGGVFVRWSFV